MKAISDSFTIFPDGAYRIQEYHVSANISKQIRLPVCANSESVRIFQHTFLDIKKKTRSSTKNKDSHRSGPNSRNRTRRRADSDDSQDNGDDNPNDDDEVRSDNESLNSDYKIDPRSANLVQYRSIPPTKVNLSHHCISKPARLTKGPAAIDGNILSVEDGNIVTIATFDDDGTETNVIRVNNPDIVEVSDLGPHDVRETIHIKTTSEGCLSIAYRIDKLYWRPLHTMIMTGTDLMNLTMSGQVLNETGSEFEGDDDDLEVDMTLRASPASDYEDFCFSVKIEESMHVNINALSNTPVQRLFQAHTGPGLAQYGGDLQVHQNDQKVHGDQSIISYRTKIGYTFQTTEYLLDAPVTIIDGNKKNIIGTGRIPESFPKDEVVFFLDSAGSSIVTYTYILNTVVISPDQLRQEYSPQPQSADQAASSNKDIDLKSLIGPGMKVIEDTLKMIILNNYRESVMFRLLYTPKPFTKILSCTHKYVLCGKNFETICFMIELQPKESTFNCVFRLALNS